jgi:hypothetical protein
VLTGRQPREIKRVPFIAAVGNPIVGEDGTPGRAVDARISSFDFAYGILNVKYCQQSFGPNLRLPH